MQVSKHPTAILFGGYTVLVIALLICAMFYSCGTRRSEVSIQKDVDKSTEKSTSEGSLSKEGSTKDATTKSEQVAKIDEKQEQRIREMFYENGGLKERITELLNSKSTDNSQKKESRLYETKINIDSNFYTTVYKDRLITKYVKVKDTEQSNLYWIIGLVVLGAIALFFVYMYLRVRKKVSPSMF